MSANEYGVRVDIYNNKGTFRIVIISANKEGGGMIGVCNKIGTLVAVMGVYKGNGTIAVYNKNGKGISILLFICGKKGKW